MSCTPRNAPGRLPGRERLLPLSCASFLVLSLAVACGCASGSVHPGFSRHQPARITVLPVANATLYPLDEVVFAGVLQRSLIGGEKYNIPDILRGGLEESLVLAGYDLVPVAPDRKAKLPDYRQPLPEGTPVPPFDAALYTSIHSWESSTGASTNIAMRFRLELYHVPTGEILFSGDFHCVHRSEARSWSPDGVEVLMRRCARQALESLPRRSIAPGT